MKVCNLCFWKKKNKKVKERLLIFFEVDILQEKGVEM